jgi:hypothetical protein
VKKITNNNNNKHMEVFETILGLLMFYTWGHTAVLMVKYMKKMSTYETAVTIIAVMGFALYVIGTIGQ